jgi:hypothetical protein
MFKFRVDNYQVILQYTVLTHVFLFCCFPQVFHLFYSNIIKFLYMLDGSWIVLIFFLNSIGMK